MIRVVVTQSAFSPEGEASRFTEALDETVGAVVSFIGLCRARSAAGEPVAKMELDHYPGFAESELERLTQTVANKHAVAEALVIHRAGVVSPGEAIVLVAVASAHRAAAFAAAEELMDRLKTDAPFWKRETGPDGAYWIEPTAEDRRRREEHSK